MSLDTNGAPTAASPTAETDETDVTAPVVAEGSTDANPAASSPADEKDAKQPTDLLSVVKDAVAKPEEVAAPSAAEGEGEAQAGEAEEKPEGKTDADQAAADAKLPFHEHPRWKEVVAERNSFREDAGRFRQIDSFMQTNGLTPQEVGEGFDVMAKLKSGTPENLAEAREFFASRLKFLDEALGNVVPDDLRQRVDAGEMTEAAAQELAKARSSDKLRAEQLKQRETVDTETQERQTRANIATAMATAVDDWEKQAKAADPDYARKADMVETTCRAIVQRTGQPPATPEQAVALVKQAYEHVSKTFKGLVPTPKPIRPAPSGSSAPTAAEPKTLREAIASAIGQ